jgi:hypothetical protein
MNPATYIIPNSVEVEVKTEVYPSGEGTTTILFNPDENFAGLRIELGCNKAKTLAQMLGFPFPDLDPKVRQLEQERDSLQRELDKLEDAAEDLDLDLGSVDRLGLLAIEGLRSEDPAHKQWALEEIAKLVGEGLNFVYTPGREPFPKITPGLSSDR